MRNVFLVFSAVAMIVQLSYGQLSSGPAVGSDVPALQVHAVTGPVTYTQVDYASQRGDQPTIYLFVPRDKWDRPIARFIKQLDQQAGEVHKDVLLVGVWLTDNPESTREYLPLAQQSLKLDRTALTYFHGDDYSPADWAINDRAHLTVVIANRKKVASTMSYVSVNETDVPKVLRALQEAVGQ